MQLKEETSNFLVACFQKRARDDLKCVIWSLTGTFGRSTVLLLNSSQVPQMHMRHRIFNISLERLGKSVNKDKWCWEGQNNVIQGGKNILLPMHSEIMETFLLDMLGALICESSQKSKKKGLHIENKAEDSIASASRFCVLYPACYKRSNLPQKPYSRIENIR